MPVAEFLCRVDTDGVAGVGDVDYTSLALWYAAMRNTANSGSLSFASGGSKSPIVVPGTLTGTVPDNSAVTQVGTSATGRLVHVNRLGQALIDRRGFTGTPDDVGAWRVDASNYWTPSGARATASLRVACRGTTVDSSVIDWADGKLVATSFTQSITIEGDVDAANLAWDATKFRWEVDTLAGVIHFSNGAYLTNTIRFRNLQVRNASTTTGSWTDATAAVKAHQAYVWLENCILRGGKHAVSIAATGTSQGRAVVQNCVGYGYTDSGVFVAGNVGPAIVQNGTFIGGLYGVRSATAAVLVENTYAHGTTAAYSGAPITKVRAVSSDATGSVGYTGIAVASAGFRDQAAADYRLALGSTLAGAGADLSDGRLRVVVDISGTQDNAKGSPVGVLAFEIGSSIAVLRVWNSISDLWFDGSAYSPNDRPLDMTVSIPLRYASTTSDWVLIATDGHGMRHHKTTVHPNIDALQAGTKGRWTAATSLGWANNTFPCVGRLKHMLILGDNPRPDDTANYGDTLDHFRDMLWNTSGEAGSPLGMNRAYWENRTWVVGGNHDRYKSTNPTDGIETWRFNQHGRSTDDQGNAYSDSSELKVAPLVGNHRFLMLGWQFDDAWAKAVAAAADAGGENLFLTPHAPPAGSTRYSYFNMTTSSQDVAFTAVPWVASICGHTHNYDPGIGLDDACKGTRRDYPNRSTWDIGAGAAPPFVPIRRPVRALGRVFRGIRV